MSKAGAIGPSTCHSVLTNHALFRRAESIFAVNGQMNVAWRRPKQKASLGGFASESDSVLPPLDATGDEPTGPANTGVDSTPASGDGLGESTAPAPKGKAKALETAGA